MHGDIASPGFNPKIERFLHLYRIEREKVTLRYTGYLLLDHLYTKIRITSYKLRGQEWSRDNGAKNVSKKTIACLSFIM